MLYVSLYFSCEGAAAARTPCPAGTSNAASSQSSVSACSVSLFVIHTRHTVNVDIFALYIFSLNSRFLNYRENMYTSKITFVKAYRANYT